MGDDARYTFAHGEPFLVELTVEPQRFALLVNDEVVYWPHGGEAKLRGAARIVWECRNAAHVEAAAWDACRG